MGLVTDLSLLNGPCAGGGSQASCKHQHKNDRGCLKKAEGRGNSKSSNASARDRWGYAGGFSSWSSDWRGDSWSSNWQQQDGYGWANDQSQAAGRKLRRW